MMAKNPPMSTADWARSMAATHLMISTFVSDKSVLVASVVAMEIAYHKICGFINGLITNCTTLCHARDLLSGIQIQNHWIPAFANSRCFRHGNDTLKTKELTQ